MNAIPFDTLKMARRLQAAGFTGDQAAGASETMAEAMSGAELATKADLLALQKDIAAEFRDVRSDIDILKTDMAGIKTDLAGVKTDIVGLRTGGAALRTDIAALQTGQNTLTLELAAAKASLESKIVLLRRDITIRAGAMFVAGTGIILGAMRLMIHP